MAKGIVLAAPIGQLNVRNSFAQTVVGKSLGTADVTIWNKSGS